MPELPEVETIRRDLEKELVGKTITNIWCDTPKLLQPSPEMFKKHVVGSFVSGVRRRGKLLVFDLSSNKYFVAHLMMTGRFFVCSKNALDQDSYIHIKFSLSSGEELRFSCLRKFGYLKVVSSDELVAMLSNYGLEPLDGLTVEKFTRIVSGRRSKIKSLLLNQKLIAGIGNIYANEALFLAGIHPDTPANKLSSAQIKKLFNCIEETLSVSLKKRGTTTSDNLYVDVYGNSGEFQNLLKVYEREGEACVICGTPIKRKKTNQRSSFFCPKCQREG